MAGEERKERKITEWAPMAGRWDVSTTNPVYLGPQADKQPYAAPFGICISDIRFQGGEAKVTVSFPKAADGGVDPNSSGGILFGFRSLREEYFTLPLVVTALPTFSPGSLLLSLLLLMVLGAGKI